MFMRAQSNQNTFPAARDRLRKQFAIDHRGEEVRAGNV
jgi:hypothetical protein